LPCVLVSVFVCYLPLLFVPHKKKILPPFQIDSCSLFEAALGVDGDCPGLVIGLRLLLVRQQARVFVCVLLFPPTILTSLFFSPFFFYEYQRSDHDLSGGATTLQLLNGATTPVLQLCDGLRNTEDARVPEDIRAAVPLFAAASAENDHIRVSLLSSAFAALAVAKHTTGKTSPTVRVAVVVRRAWALFFIMFILFY